jgi:RNA recognition motif-containing protein
MYGFHDGLSQSLPCDNENQTNLIVNYLPPQLNEEQFLELFSVVGPVVSVRMMKNDDGTPRGYGFVRFQHPEHANRAIQLYNGYELWGKRLKAAFTRSGSGPREDCNIFATNLPACWSTETLYENFGRFGEILEARILTDGRGRSRLCGFVRFNKPEAAIDAIEQFNLHVPQGAYRPIKVRLAKKQADHWKSKGVGPYSREKAMFLRKNNSHENWGQRQPMAHEYGSSYSMPLLHEDNEINKITSSMQSVLSYPSEIVPDVTEQSVFKTEQTSKSDQSSTRLFLCNLPIFFKEDNVKHFCGEYGKVLGVELQTSQDDVSLGMGWVTFATRENALVAQKSLHGCDIFNQKLSCKLEQDG